MSDMEHVASADGTHIAYRTVGSATPVVLVGGALAPSDDAAQLAAAVGGAGMQAVTYDRRGRGESGDTAPYAPGREAEDLRAVIDAAGGDAAVFGHSSGVVLALLAAGHGVPMRRLFLSGPPLRFGVDEPRRGERRGGNSTLLA